MRSQFLRDKHRRPLWQRAIDVHVSDGATLLKEMEAAYKESNCCPSSSFDPWARNVLRGCARIKEPKGRRQYIIACITNQRRIAQLEEWLRHHQDPDDLGLDDDERRAISDEEWAAYMTERSKAERELSALQNGTGGLAILKERVGAEQAGKLLATMMKVIDIRTIRGQRRLNSIMVAAAQPNIRHPGKYIEKVIRNERQRRK